MGRVEQISALLLSEQRKRVIEFMQSPVSILLIEDNEEHAKIISRHLRKAENSTIRLHREERLSEGLKRLAGGHFDVILLDLRLPDSDIENTLPAMVRTSPATPIVVLSSVEDRAIALNAVHEGAQDYLCKADLSSELLIRAIYSAMERKQTEARIKAQAAQKSALFELSQYAINEPDVSKFISKATEFVSKTLSTDFVSVLELMPDKKELLLKSGLGWKPGYVGQTLVPATLSSLCGYTLLSNQSVIKGDLKTHRAVIVADLKSDKRFRCAPYLLDHFAVSGMSVIIYGQDEDDPYGVLGCFTTNHRIFSSEDADFLQAVANTMAAAILRHRLDEELKGKIRELDVAHRRKDEFLATLSHELRTPLNVITGYVELLKTLEQDSPEFAEALSAIERNAKIEVQLVSDTLDVSRIITGKMTLEVSNFSFEDVVDSAIESIRFSAQAKSLSIQKTSVGETTSFVGDENKIRQMIWNLLTNAVKFTPPGGVIRVDLRASGSDLELLVRDTGKGIAPGSLHHVFERFWQEDAGINRQYMGLGLGLAIVRHIVELHGGTAHVESEGLEKGTTFKIRLPKVSDKQKLGEGKSASSMISRATPGTTNWKGSLGGVQILCIDDSPDSLLVLSHLLKRAGASVKTCPSSGQGLAEAETNQYDVIISDIGMPEMDGYELMKRLRSWETQNRRSQVPSIALTAHVNPSDVEDAHKAGYHLHLSKPVNVRDLEEAVRRLLIQA